VPRRRGYGAAVIFEMRRVRSPIGLARQSDDCVSILPASSERLGMSDNRNLILSIILSAITIIAWQYFIGRHQSGTDLEPLQDLVRRNMAGIVFQGLFAAAVLAIGGGLYALRQFRRRTYAFLEVVFGMGAAVYAANTFYFATTGDDRARSIVATFAGIYIIVRGFDNWREGQKLVPPRPVIDPRPFRNVTSKEKLQITRTS
jgi:hypothetical protein